MKTLHRGHVEINAWQNWICFMQNFYKNFNFLKKNQKKPQTKQAKQKTKETKKSGGKSYLNVHTWHKWFKKDEDVTW